MNTKNKRAETIEKAYQAIQAAAGSTDADKVDIYHALNVLYNQAWIDCLENTTSGITNDLHHFRS